MKRQQIAALLLVLLGTANAAEPDVRFLQSLGDIRYHPVHAEEVERDFHVYVRLPEGYAESDDEYPTLYVLDGGELLPMFASYYRYLNFGEEVPDMIIVGIAYGSDDFEGGNFRSTDYTAPSAEREYWGGAGGFQAFLEAQLFPLVEGEYRSRQSRRIVFGHSIGGQFVLYTAMTKPKLFWGHVASNPALHRNLEFFLEEQADYSGPAQTRLFVASGTNDDPRFREPALQWAAHWTDRDVPWRWQFVDLDGHSHMSAPPAAFRQGLGWLFVD